MKALQCDTFNNLLSTTQAAFVRYISFITVFLLLGTITDLKCTRILEGEGRVGLSSE